MCEWRYERVTLRLGQQEKSTSTSGVPPAARLMNHDFRDSIILLAHLAARLPLLPTDELSRTRTRERARERERERERDLAQKEISIEV